MITLPNYEIVKVIGSGSFGKINFYNCKVTYLKLMIIQIIEKWL